MIAVNVLHFFLSAFLFLLFFLLLSLSELSDGFDGALEHGDGPGT
jgi:phosphatidylglycerophosphate synthase